MAKAHSKLPSQPCAAKKIRFYIDDDVNEVDLYRKLSVAGLDLVPHGRGRVLLKGNGHEQPKRTIEERIEDERNRLFGAMAMVGVARESTSSDENYDLWRLLGDAYDLFDRAAAELNAISGDAKELEVIGGAQ